MHKTVEQYYLFMPRWRWCLTNIGILIVEIRWSYDCLISTMGYPLQVSWHSILNQGANMSSIVVTPSGDENRIFQENLVNTISADAMPTCTARSSTATPLSVWDKQVRGFNGEVFLITCAISMARNERKFTYIFMFPQNYSACRVYHSYSVPAIRAHFSTMWDSRP